MKLVVVYDKSGNILSVVRYQPKQLGLEIGMGIQRQPGMSMLEIEDKGEFAKLSPTQIQERCRVDAKKRKLTKLRR